jgi:hypothetical protein
MYTIYFWPLSCRKNVSLVDPTNRRSGRESRGERYGSDFLRRRVGRSASLALWHESTHGGPEVVSEYGQLRRILGSQCVSDESDVTLL